MQDCRRLGKTRVEVVSEVAFVKRSDEKVEQELTELARNEAAKVGGDMIVPISSQLRDLSLPAALSPLQPTRAVRTGQGARGATLRAVLPSSKSFTPARACAPSAISPAFS